MDTAVIGGNLPGGALDIIDGSSFVEISCNLGNNESLKKFF